MSELAPKSPRDSEVVMTQMILPSDANPVNAAFGGKVMEWIDVCGAIAAQRHCRQVVVTASMDDLHFHAPIKVGWNVTLHARVIATFRTSMEVGVTVTAENPMTGDKHLTTSALLTFVALTADGKKVPVPPLKLETEQEHEAFREAEQRRQDRLTRKQTSLAWQRVIKPGVAG
ncbi:acyl-CoA thioesterase [Archangium violaceum]|uniref:acyl-CoA thioesterase n=1 Tax=Archangium violaceum TaxID=83451 RepID=UPI00194E3558|nr:acyl-CoA thioesterase [Archangium violaceum]QRO00581.1 acyl-CoA thioesterase [Archangium violaceum]